MILQYYLVSSYAKIHKNKHKEDYVERVIV